MSQIAHPFMGKVFVGSPCAIGKNAELYSGLLMDGEAVDIEFQGVRDGAIFTDRRLLVWNKQGLMGKKHEFSTFPWRSVTAFALENSGTFDLEAEFKICGSGWGVCEVVMTKGTDVRAVLAYMNRKILA
jgi:hypothetical protein